MKPQDTPSDIPYGYCHCGCGQKTRIAPCSDKHRGHTRGVPLLYVHGHNGLGIRRVEFSPPNPTGLCLCGCGGPTPIATKTDSAVPQLRGYANRYLPGHYGRKNPIAYVEADCGFHTPCWVWQRAQDGRGYGRSKGRRSHQEIYEQFKGPVPKDLQLDHLCRNRLCCNPDHLEPVTNQVNAQRGAGSKLNPERVRHIRNLAGLMSHRAIARMLHIPRSTVGGVIRRERWANVE